MNVKDVLKDPAEALGSRFKIKATPEVKNGFDNETHKSTGVPEKIVFRVACQDVCETVDVSIKDISLRPEDFPAGTLVGLEGLKFNLYQSGTKIALSIGAASIHAITATTKA